MPGKKRNALPVPESNGQAWLKAHKVKATRMQKAGCTMAEISAATEGLTWFTLRRELKLKGEL